MQKTLLALITPLLASAVTAQTWTQQMPANPPSARYGGAAAFDGRGNVIVFGGLTTGPTTLRNDTYAWNGTDWTLVAGTPPGRWGHQMVYDSKRRVIVTFGGRSPSVTATANDTWEFDVATRTWTQATPVASPGARAFYSMAYDERRGVCQIFGSQSTFNGGELWEYDGKTWTLSTAANGPVSRDQPGLCYDKSRGVTVLFGGWYALSPGVMYDDTWEYDGKSWKLVPTATKPIARYRTSMVYDDRRGRIVMYGGFGNATALTDTWEYDGNDWTQVASTGPAKSTQGYAAYDLFRGNSVYFGGTGPGGAAGETWTYAGATTAIFASYGQGCPTSSGAALIQGKTLPKIGSNFSFDVTNVPAASGVAILLQGFSSLTWGPIPLPLDITGAGFAGCQLEVAVDFVSGAPIVSNTATAVLPLPNTTSLVGLQYYVQALLLDAQAPNGVAGMSNAGRAVLGN